MKNYEHSAIIANKRVTLSGPLQMNATFRAMRLRLMRAGMDVSKIHDDDLERHILPLDILHRNELLRKAGVTRLAT
jgi:hypothetical protein